MKKLTINGILTLLVLSLAVSCADLNVQNLNEPDTQRALGSDTDLRSVADGLYRNWYNSAHLYTGIKMALSTAADATTCSWGNSAMRLMGNEPRQPWDNAPNYSYEYVTSNFFDELMSINSSATDVLAGINDGIQFGDGGADTPMVTAQAKLAQGLTIGYIGLLFDQGYVVDENSSEEEIINPELKSHDVLVEHAITKLEEAASIAANNSFTVPSNVINATTTITNVEFEKLVHSYIARFMAYAPRNASQNSQVDWAAVQSHAEQGLDFDFKIQPDGLAPWQGSQWFDEALVYLIYPGWGRMDMRLISMMENDYPSTFTDGGNTDDYAAPQDTSAIEDMRLVTDVQYLPSNNFRTERGYYHFSNFRHDRYGDYISGWSIGLPEFLKAENDLLLAEAYVQQGMLTQAATLINNGTRTSRGQMPDVAPNESDLNDAIHHERMIELFLGGLGIQFFEMRKKDLLQEGTVLHFPLPAKTLEVLGRSKPFYTFGGVENADGVNASDGGWK